MTALNPNICVSQLYVCRCVPHCDHTLTTRIVLMLSHGYLTVWIACGTGTARIRLQCGNSGPVLRGCGTHTLETVATHGMSEYRFQ